MSPAKMRHTPSREPDFIAIYVALQKYNNGKLIDILTYSQTRLHAIQNHMQRPSHTTYHHQKSLLTTIVNTLRYRESLNLHTNLQKIEGKKRKRFGRHGGQISGHLLRGNSRTPKNKQAERPRYWVLYTNNPITPAMLLSTGSHSLTPPPWWTIPEMARRYMH
jgi:hypothetical protein